MAEIYYLRCILFVLTLHLAFDLYKDIRLHLERLVD
jgi:hypothetical protein